MARGSIRSRQTRSGIVYDVTYDVSNGSGKRRQQRRTLPTRRKAERFLAEQLAGVSRGEIVGETRETFATYAERWLAEHRHRIELSTAIDYENTLRNHLVPFFGAMRLAKITTADVRRYVAAKVEGTGPVRDQPAGKGGRIKRWLSPKTINNQITLLGTIFGHAAADGLIARNPVAGADKRRPLKLKTPHRERDYLRPDEVPRYLAAASDFWRPRALTLILTGMRVGELCGLRFADIDWAGGAVIVRRSRKRDHTVGSTKGDETGRRVDAGPVLLAALADQRVLRAEHDGAHADDLVFPDPASELDTPRRLLDHEHRRALERAGLRLSLVNHELRHTAAAAWLSSGLPLEYVRRQIGHASIATTIANYGHLEPSMMPDAAARTEAALGIRDMGVTWTPSGPSPKNAKTPRMRGFRSSSGRTRTYNPPVNSRMLCH
jgi:integrase